MKHLSIRPSTELYVASRLLTANRLLELCDGQRVVLIADAALKERYGAELARRLSAELLTIPSGKEAKTLETAQNLIGALSKMGCGRDTLLIAFGGGATTDLVGFVASIYMRGVPLVLIPTTLLAMVDAAIGGKTAIDTPYGKNLVGTFYPPKAIFADLDLLETLPDKEWFNGLAEILKMGLISAPSLWEMGKKTGKDPDLILKAIEEKIRIVEQDPTEQGLRRILNFGHTIGHALETALEYTISHGEAVALGCVAEAHLSMQLGYLSHKEFTEIEATYRPFVFQLPESYLRDKLTQAIVHDKKRALGQTRFVLIDKIGHPLPFHGAYCRTVTQTELEPTLDWMESWKSLH